ncbi:MAG: hypothetical protein ACYC3X_03920 [Pirellulaceae bacterium]
MLRSCRLAVLVTLAGLVTVGASFQSPIRWKTGKEFEHSLNTVVSDVVWSAGTSVRQAVTTLARTQGVAIMLDRRIDPESAIELSVHDVTLYDVFEQLAAQCDAAPCYLADVAYLGPRVGLGDMPAVANARRAEAQKFPRPVARRLLAERACRWDELSEPRKLIEELAREANVTIDGMAELPHDLWPAIDLPALAWTDRMTLVLAGFGKTFEFAEGGQRIRLVPIPASSVTSRTYPADVPSARLDDIRVRFPQAEIQADSQQITLRGTPQEHERLQKLLQKTASGRSASRPAGKTVLTLQVNSQPVDAILKTLERQLELSFQFDGELAEQLRTRVTFDVHEATLQELLQAALTPAGLAFRQQGEVIVIMVSR